MPANNNNVGKKSQALRGRKPAPAQPPAKKAKMPPKGSREEAQQKLEHLRQDLRDVIRKELAIAKQKQSVLDRIKHWKKELGARPEDKDADALADALFDKIVKGEQEELAAIGDYNKEGVQSFVQAVQDDE
ncbi:hypothetical protein TGAMA5MH_02885 [Trichoderma gamsii]|uniref:Uncharacterized protein n=1 Tax=Trichoderma gamsii TaxID=398673 RepID=A0A2K0TJF0_9HYPO|nr:hypothetical protein TGAMA5MH_02885 [Trichoderma gamsii]